MLRRRGVPLMPEPTTTYVVLPAVRALHTERRLS